MWVDAGPGTFAKLQRHTDASRLTAIRTSHLHAACMPPAPIPCTTDMPSGTGTSDSDVFLCEVGIDRHREGEQVHRTHGCHPARPTRLHRNFNFLCRKH
jgi:hypothetical protein